MEAHTCICIIFSNNSTNTIRKGSKETVSSWSNIPIFGSLAFMGWLHLVASFFFSGISSWVFSLEIFKRKSERSHSIAFIDRCANYMVDVFNGAGFWTVS